MSPSHSPLPLADIPILVGSSGCGAGVGAVAIPLHGFQKVCRKKSWSRSSSGCAEAQGALAQLCWGFGQWRCTGARSPLSAQSTHLGPEHRLQPPQPQAPCSIVSSPWNKGEQDLGRAQASSVKWAVETAEQAGNGSTTSRDIGLGTENQHPQTGGEHSMICQGTEGLMGTVWALQW